MGGGDMEAEEEAEPQPTITPYSPATAPPTLSYRGRVVLVVVEEEEDEPSLNLHWAAIPGTGRLQPPLLRYVAAEREASSHPATPSGVGGGFTRNRGFAHRATSSHAP